MAAGAVGCAARTPVAALVWAEVFAGLDTTVFRLEGSRSLRVFSTYLGIDTTAGQLPAGRQLLLAATSTPGNRGRRVRASAHVSPPALQTCVHTGAPALGLSLEGVSHEQALRGNGLALLDAALRSLRDAEGTMSYQQSGRDEHREPLPSPTRAS